MTVIITRPALGGNPVVAEPLMRLGIEYEVESRNVVHRLITGDGPFADIAVTLRPASLRSGALQLLFPDEASAVEAIENHRLATEFILEDTDHPLQDMRYVVVGKMRAALDRSTRVRWTVTIPYQEIGAPGVPT